MGQWYRVVKTIKGHHYLYEQQTYREGGHVRTRNRYLGPAGAQESRSSSLGGKGELSITSSGLASALADGLLGFGKEAVRQFDAPRWGTDVADQLGLAKAPPIRARSRKRTGKVRKHASAPVPSSASDEEIPWPSHRHITNAYPPNFLGIDMAHLEGLAKKSGYNLWNALIKRVDSTADLGEKIAAIHAIWDEMLHRIERQEAETVHERAVTTIAADSSAAALRAPGTAHEDHKDAGISSHGPRDVQEEITNTIIAAIESGKNTGTFQMPWHAIASEGWPVNFTTHQPYHGANVLMLCFVAMRNEWPNQWASFNQWKERGAHVRKGEHGVPIIFYTSVEIKETEKDEDGTEKEVIKAIPVLRYATVFNIAQVDNPPKDISEPAKSQVNPIAAAEQFVAATKADIRYGGNEAYYLPARDRIHIPKREAFIGSKTSSPTEAFYATTLHELCHWTSHASRLNREIGKRFGDDAYAYEELVAELGAAFACAKLGISPELRQDHIQYVASWLRILKADKRAIFTAASAAANAVEYLEALQPAAS